ncbi:hypothetical protein HYN76_23380 [Vibrio parahaemolyticus]|uniref:hypothetical protein n=1 Tax=Vibrio parahaemolyticus TaxID=670 RepID=UPI000A3CFA4E|nr:hypothetical protein [Vibrio parahaemolyticus]EHV5548603.1 hypothetical protein [Vibrio parahaemolyticus]MBM5091915.1 hypothetical protein [Vibrio parahaemolyticus]MBM5184763.1 hypothetical protein [Vibrio parahaemolyticus]OUD43426.1 hypothetical protein BS624_22805 [Vibrio parahaemolyticus]HCG8602425.1 hypothetical protein [Vibrio parahaemolyticus]
MPFTPLHMGPALVLKSVVGTSFSLTVFGWSQIVMDIEPLIAMLAKSGHIHGLSHTIGGATLLGLLAAVTGKYLSEIGLSIIRWQRFLPIRWKTAFISSFVGTYSHIFIDAIMHVDVSPFYPLSVANPLHGVISISSLQQVCIVSAVVGGILCVVRDSKSSKA